jgi:hypothetical protein
MVYSIGSNFMDDGGILDSKTDVGAGPISGKIAKNKP